MRTILRRFLPALAVIVIGAATAPSLAEAAEPVDPPHLLSFSVGPGPYPVGGVIPFQIDVDDFSKLFQIQVTVAERVTGRNDGFRTSWVYPEASGVTTFEHTIPSSGEEMPLSGVQYLVETITLHAYGGHSYDYNRDGSYSGEAGTHDIPITQTMTFVGSTRDYTPPALSAFTMSAGDVEVGQPVSIEYRASDPHLYSIQAWAKDQYGRWFSLFFAGDVGLPSAGTGVWKPETAGTFELVRVDVEDRFGNVSRYYPSGRLTQGAGSNAEAVVGTHSVPLRQTPLEVRPVSVTDLTASARSGAVTLSWSQPFALGHRIVVSPSGRVVTGGPDNAHPTRDITITGLSNGAPYSFSVSATAGDIVGTASRVTSQPRMGALRVFGTGDRTKDGRADLLAAPVPTDQSSSATWRIYQGAGRSTFGRTLTTTIPAAKAPIPGSSTGRGPGAPMGGLHLDGGDLVEPTTTGSRVVGKGFDIFRTIDASSDLTSDGISDLIGITPAGDCYVYPSTTTGAIGRGVRLGGGWGAFQTVFSPGDFSGDQRSDIVAVDGLGKLWLYPGNGRAGFGARVLIGAGWATFGSVFPMRDFSGDGRVDIGAITMDGKLRLYPGNGRGGFLPSSQIGVGWGVFL